MADQHLYAGDFTEILETKLGLSGLLVTAAFEVLDGPDYGGSEGCITVSQMKQALESLPEEEAGEEEAVDDPIGGAIAEFFSPDCIIESLSWRACGLDRYQMRPVCSILKKCPWQLRVMNLWENNLCDRCAAMLGSAFEEYRGFEYIGLG